MNKAHHPSTATAPQSSRRQWLGGLTAMAAGFAAWRAWPAWAAEAAVTLPPPAEDLPANGATSGTTVFAGGCFWGVQAVFQHVKGVTQAVSGYAGGAAATAKYDEVGSGRTGHAEAVQVTYNPAEISYGRLLQIYFSVAHDPTQLNRQGPDSGTQYRSTVFPANAEQLRVTKAYIAQLDQARLFGGKIVTTLEAGIKFYPAEAYHQDFMARHPAHPYIVVNDRPKVENLKRIFASLYRDQPVLVNGA